MAAALFFSRVADGLRAFIKVQPGASRNAIEDVVADADGTHYLKVRVTTAPEKGKANKDVIKMLSKEWKLPASSITITARETSRLKTFHIKGNPETLEAHLLDWLSVHASKR